MNERQAQSLDIPLPPSSPHPSSHSWNLCRCWPWLLSVRPAFLRVHPAPRRRRRAGSNSCDSDSVASSHLTSAALDLSRQCAESFHPERRNTPSRNLIFISNLNFSTFMDSGGFTLHRNWVGISIYFVLQVDNKRIGCMKIDNELLFLQELIRVKPGEKIKYSNACLDLL